MSLYADIAWGRKTNLTQEELNKRAKVIADAIEELRAFAPDWESQVEALRAVGLERINAALLPAYEQIIQVSNLGALFSAKSETTLTIGLGTRTFTIRENQRLNFAPTPYLMAYADDDYGFSMVGTVSGYDSATGELVLSVVSTIGTGTFDDWTLSPIATTADLEALRTQVLDAQADVAAKKDVVDTKHADVVSVGGRYLGDFAVAPPGAVLGQQYLDTSTVPNVVKVLTSTGWAPTVTVSVGGRRTQDYPAATAGQKGPFTVDGGFSTGDVFVNGVLLRAPAEVTLAPGPSGTFTLVEGLAGGDIVSFRGFLANDATDIYTKSEVNTLIGDAVDAGTIVITTGNTPPPGTIKGNGALLSRTAYERLFRKIVKRLEGVVISIASPGVITWPNHGLNVTDPVVFTTTGALPTGLVAGTTYYVAAAGYAAGSFTVSATPGGAAINTTGAQSGVHTAESAPWGRGDGITTFQAPELRAEFLRGWDDGRGIDTNRVFGSQQLDAFQGHKHESQQPMSMRFGADAVYDADSSVARADDMNPTWLSTAMQVAPVTDGVNGTPRTAAETRPRSRAVLMCVKY